MLWEWNKKILCVEISAKLCFTMSFWTKQWLLLVLYIAHTVAEMIKYSSQIEIVFDAALSPTGRGSINWLIGMQVMLSLVKFYYDSEVKFWWHNSWLWIFLWIPSEMSKTKHNNRRLDSLSLYNKQISINACKIYRSNLGEWRGTPLRLTNGLTCT